MSKVYTYFHKLEQRFPNIIFELNYSKITKMGRLIIRDRNKLGRYRVYEIHYFRVGKPISFFLEETGKSVNILKEIKIFDKYIKSIEKDPYGTNPDKFWRI